MFGTLILTVALFVVATAGNEDKSLAEVSVLHGKHFDPKELQLEVQAFGDVYQFHLIPAPQVFHPNLREYLSGVNENGTNTIMRAIDPQSNHMKVMDKLYTDKSGHASVHVEEMNGHVYVEGKLNENMRIVPTSAKDGSDDPIHIAYRDVKPESGDYLPHGTCKSVTPNFTFPSSPKIEERAVPSVVYPEVLLVLDYEMSKFFQFNQDAVKKYIAIFFNSVNKRYDTIDYPKIRNVITDIILTLNEGSQPFVARGPENIVDSEKTLEQFGIWLFKQQNSIRSSYDVAYWLTGLDLASADGASFDTAVQGVGYVGGACMVGYDRNYKVGIGEDVPGKYYGIHTAAHETAHLYGSAHDGQIVNNPAGNPGAVSCPWDQGYIMSYEFGTKNKFFYSSCSIRQISYTLQSSQASCLLNNPSTNIVATTNQPYPGETVSLNDQCKAAHGDNTYFYTPYQAQACVKRWCATSGGNGWSVSLTASGPAYEGSPCGSGMWCIKGQCVSK